MNTTTILLLGILLVSPVAADFCEGNYVVEAGNWSNVEIQDGGTVTGHTYNWKDDKSGDWNRGRMNNPTRYDMPSGTVLHPPPVMKYKKGGTATEYVSWIAVYDVQYTYTVVHNGHTYTNNTSSMSYRAAWLEKPCRHISDMNRYVDEVTVEPAIDGVRFCVWQHWTDSDRDKHHSYGETTIPAGIEDVRAWETPNTSIHAKLTNSSMGYFILDVPVRGAVLGYRVDAVGDSHTAFYEHNGFMMQRNVTATGKEFFDVVRAPNTDSSGMSAFGASKFILPEDTNYKINVTAYTPFEQIRMNVSMTQEERERQTTNKRSVWLAFLTLLTVPLGIYFVIRGMV